MLAAAVPGAKVCDLCALGDKTVEAEAAKFYNKKDKDGNKIDKGIAFPTCVSVNNQVCHNSPLDDNTVVLEEGQAVKIDLGAHVDGALARCRANGCNILYHAQSLGVILCSIS